ncbi:MAG: matrixin family metalloprotease, partial [Acidobacteria bacterium]|nr:matrixin family metalloprotease [Acidobacteriota bacterium]
MKRFRSFGSVSAFAAVALALAALAVRAEGPLTVGGLAPFVEGVPFRWNIDPFTYWTDLGQLGNQSNAQADTLVTQAFQAWQDVSTANINFSSAGKLGADVTSSNYMSFVNDLNDCGNPLGSIAKDRSIVYDVDGSIVTAIGDDPNSLLGFAFPACYDSNGSENFYTRGIALLNGMWIDGQPDSSTNGEVTLAEFRAVFIHEFGHLIGLDHTQINIQDFQNLPTMFPLLFGVDQASLAVDDIAGISELYPEATNNPPTRVPFLATTGRIRGQIFFSDGLTPVQGLNVIARRVDNPSRI